MNVILIYVANGTTSLPSVPVGLKLTVSGQSVVKVRNGVVKVLRPPKTVAFILNL